MMAKEEVTLRSIKINGAPVVGNNTGFFHGWCIEPLYDSGQIYSKTLALVELGDGKVRLIEPQYLQFTEPYEKPGKE